MTINIDDVFIEIDNILAVSIGFDWLDIIGFDDYFEIRDKIKTLTKKEQIKYLDSFN